MFRPLLLILTSFVAACQSVTQEPSEPPPDVSGKVVCIETQDNRTALAVALSKTQDGDVLMTGVSLIDELDAMCNIEVGRR